MGDTLFFYHPIFRRENGWWQPSRRGAQILGTSSLLWTLGSTWALQLHSHYLCKNHISGDITRMFYVIETRYTFIVEKGYSKKISLRFTTTPCINQKQEDTLVMFYFFFSVFVGLPQVLQKNMGLFSFLSQLAHFGNSSQVDSTRKRSKWSEGGSEWPSRRGVNFLQKRISILSLRLLLLS